MIDVPLAFAFSGGVVAAFNPCGAAMFPAYVGYQLGTARAERSPVAGGLDKVRRALGRARRSPRGEAPEYERSLGPLEWDSVRGRPVLGDQERDEPALGLLARGLREMVVGLVAAGVSGMRVGLAATAGFVVVFGAVGLILAAGGRVVGHFLPFAGLAVGVAIAALGLWLLVSGRKIGIMSASRVNLGAGRGIVQVFLFGIAYAVASLSCALPIFLAAVGIVAGQTLTGESFAETVVGSLAYGLGMGVVMIAVAVGVVLFKGLAQRTIRRVLEWVEPVGKLAMVGAGAYLIYYWLAGSGRELFQLRVDQYFG